MSRHRESPLRRVNPSGKAVWVARYTGPDGRRRSAGSFALKREAQDAIDAAYDLPVAIDSVGGYFHRWPALHPRATRTQATNEHRVSRALNVKIQGRALQAWPYRDLRRRHALILVDDLLREQGRSALGATHVLRALSLMTEDAITDEVVDVNAFRGVTIRASDPRVTKPPREIRVFTFEQMHKFAAQAGKWEAMVRVFSDCGLRLGEVLPLRREDFTGNALRVSRTAHEGHLLEGTKTDHGATGAGRLVPVPASLAALLRAMPPRIDTELLFPTLTGRLWRESNFYRDVWRPARAVSGLDIRPHEMRHSWVTHLRAAGIDDADLADVAGHTVQTMIQRYTHALRRSFDEIREVVG